MKQLTTIICIFTIITLSCKKQENHLLVYDYGNRIPSLDKRNLQDPIRQKFITQALLIREGFQKWASEHQDIVKQPDLNTDEKELERKFKRLYETLPSRSKDAGVSGFVLNPNNSHLGDKDSIILSWNAFKPSDKNDSPESIYLQNYKKHKDFALCSSVNVGAFDIIVWASGRITENCTGNVPCKDIIIKERYEFTNH